MSHAVLRGMLCVSQRTGKAMPKQNYTAKAATSTIAKQSERPAWRMDCPPLSGLEVIEWKLKKRLLR